MGKLKRKFLNKILSLSGKPPSAVSFTALQVILGLRAEDEVGAVGGVVDRLGDTPLIPDYPVRKHDHRHSRCRGRVHHPEDWVDHIAQKLILDPKHVVRALHFDYQILAFAIGIHIGRLCVRKPHFVSCLTAEHIIHVRYRIVF